VERLSGGTRLFDVIVLEYRLPDSNDLHLLEVIRGLAPDSSIIMTTAFGTPETLAGALRLGVYRVVPKPFDVHDLARLVAEARLSARGASVG
jgi:DNA-binding NtrC family response regulator